MTTAVISSRGQIVIPSSLRKKMDLRSGDRLVFELDEKSDELIIRRVQSIDEMADRFNSWIKPGTIPLEDTAAIYDARTPRL